MATSQVYKHPLHTQNGFTLIETLVALLVFSIGILSIALHTTQSMKARVNTQVHSSVMQIATQVLEPLVLTLNSSRDAFENNLRKTSNLSTPPFIQNNDVSSRFNVNLRSALDANNQPLLNTPNASWQMPVTLILDVSYLSEKGDALSFSVTRVLAP